MITYQLVKAGIFRGFAVSAILIGILAAQAHAQRPQAAELLPENTLAMISVANARDLAARFMNTDLGRMTEDPQMKPIVTQLYGSLTELVATVQNVIGLSLPEILAIPQGEVSFAVVAVKEDSPAIVLLLDAGDQIANARKLLDNAIKNNLFEDKGIEKREETFAGMQIIILDKMMAGNKPLVIFEKAGTIVLGNNIEVVKNILTTWNGGKNKPLSGNYNFNAIMNRCRGDKDERPQIVWFVDPINFMRSAAEMAPPAKVAVAMLPLLGLDGLSAIGGSMIFDAGQYNTVSHFHLLLENPRSGIIKMIALEPGISKPERWVPTDVASYMTLHCKFDVALSTLKPMYDSISGEGALSNLINQRFSTPLGVDIEKQILPALQGRVTYITWFEKPISQAGAIPLVGIKFKDTEALAKAVENLASRQGQTISKQAYAGKNYFRYDIPLPPARPNRPAPDASQLPIPCFGIVDDYLLIANRPGAYEKVLLTLSEGTKSLADELEYKLVASKIQRQSGGAKPVMLGFDRPEENMKYWYDLANAEKTRENLKKRAEGNPFFKSIDTALQSTPLPPFEVIQRYLAPGGSMATDDDSGLHIMSFSLRRKTD